MSKSLRPNYAKLQLGSGTDVRKNRRLDEKARDGTTILEPEGRGEQAMMNISQIKKIGVAGAGMMGNQIAEVLSRVGGFQVVLVDLNDELVNRGLQAIDSRLEKFFVAKGKLTADDKKQILKRIVGTASLEKGVNDVDILIEAVLENMSIKKDIFKRADENAPLHAILASNTSYLNVTEMASATKRPDKVVGMHFFNPPGMMKLVEIPRAALTSDATVETIKALAVKLGKEPVVCTDSSYGFLANRVYAPMRMEAVQMVWERVASPADIDHAVKLGFNLPMGPLELSDRIGSWGIQATSEEERLRELGEKGRIHPLVRMMIRAGYTGGVGKKGIYDFWEEVLSRR
jgi:3-hydroxybutyryl-CoA dehydrogenase